jgi:dTDP-4-amino-4,6-dideoxygalactose transaminase
MKTIPLYDIASQNAPLQKELAQAAARVLKSGRFVLGDEGSAFERAFASAHGAKFGIGVSSGTSALQLSLAALGVKPGDEVLTTPFTFIATANAIAHLGAVPTFADIDEDTMTLDPGDVERRLTPKTKGLVPVHLFGLAADMEGLLGIAKKRGLFVLEDAAQAHLAESGGRRVGSQGDAAAFSFYPTKNLGAAGDAGLVTTNREDLDGLLRLLRNNGSSLHDKYLHPVMGDNARLDEVQAAILKVKFAKLALWTEQRRKRAEIYLEELAGLPLRLPVERKGDRHVYHLFVVRTPKRDALARHLKERGVASAVYYPVPLHLQPAHRPLGYKAGDFPKAEQAAREVLALPIFPELTVAQVRFVCKQVRDFFGA